MLRTPQRAKYCKCTSLVGALWQPSFMRAGGDAADAFRGARLPPSATAETPEEARNFLRFMVHSISPGGVLGVRTHPVCAKSPWAVRQYSKTRRKFPQSVGISGVWVW